MRVTLPLKCVPNGTTVRKPPGVKEYTVHRAVVIWLAGGRGVSTRNPLYPSNGNVFLSEGSIFNERSEDSTVTVEVSEETMFEAIQEYYERQR